MTIVRREWPSNAANVTRSTPACAALVAKVCLSAYSLNGATLERLTAHSLDACCLTFWSSSVRQSSGSVQSFAFANCLTLARKRYLCIALNSLKTEVGIGPPTHVPTLKQALEAFLDWSKTERRTSKHV